MAKDNKVTANFALVQPRVQADAPKIGHQIALAVGKDETPTLKQMGVKLGQGFYYGRPSNINDLVRVEESRSDIPGV